MTEQAQTRRELNARDYKKGRGVKSYILGFIGFLGELMITVGVLLGLFVVWQLFWTDVQFARHQKEIFQELNWEAPKDTPAVQIPTGDPPIIDEPEEGSIIGALYVPKFGADYEVAIAEGIDKRTILDKLGIGHYEDTAMPGDIGNFALAGHRVTYGKPFNKIAELEPGDSIIVLVDGKEQGKYWYVYEVTNSLIVDPDEIEVIQPAPKSMPLTQGGTVAGRYITLTACHPMYSLKERYITHGELKYWLPFEDGTPQELLDAKEGK